LASAKPSCAGHGRPSVPVAKDGEKGPPVVALVALMLQKVCNASYTFW